MFWLRTIFIAVVIHFVFIVDSLGASNSRTHYLKLDKMEACDGSLNTPVQYLPAQIFFNDNELIVNYNVTVKSNIGKDLESVWVIEKCASKESLNTCQQFYKMRSGRYCSFLQAKGEVWSSFIDCTSPRFECPFKKGTYIGKNCKLDLSLFRLFPMQNSYWRAKIIINDVKTKQMISCTNSAGGMAKL